MKIEDIFDKWNREIDSKQNQNRNQNEYAYYNEDWIDKYSSEWNKYEIESYGI